MRHEGLPARADLRGTLAVYTTIYPGVEAFLVDWYRSLQEQTDQEFQLWIGLDKLESKFVENVVGCDLGANWVTARFGATPAQIRQQALSQIADVCCAVVLVDSDDLLRPSRVATARASLLDSDLAGCALRLVDKEGKDLDLTFDLPPQVEPDDVFPRNNIFGFSNSAFRSDLLKRCLPIPADAVLVDWFLATRAWLLGAKLTFDRVPRMDYRQHPSNVARVRFPVEQEQVVSDTALVRRHLQLLLAEPASDYLPERYAALKNVRSDVEEFHQHIVGHPAKLGCYVDALNALQPSPLWWTCVAYPALRRSWS